MIATMEPKVKLSKDEALEKLGITSEVAYRPIKDALEATKEIEVFVNDKIQKIQVPDIAKRQWGTEQFAKLKGHYTVTAEVTFKISEAINDARSRVLNYDKPKIIDVKIEPVVAEEEI